ncbi:MAG: cob(I)yrinic acid a,c-diamide adenosyltransferase [Clostridia bacterium]|nr:cob(I)yrinic acid a,c-diamide adenosyltransferase [Clostridia bacterium]
MSQATNERGLLMVYTGNGKGKTTAALGQALRAIGHGRKVCVVQFMKGSKNYGELQAAAMLVPNLVIVQSGLETFVDSHHPAQIDIDLARRGLEVARNAAASGEYQLIILDEINVALDFHLLALEEVIQFIREKPPRLDLILTGRRAAPEIVGLADLVSEIVEIKHHYTAGVEAREGIEF